MALTHGVEGKSYGLWRYDSEIGAVHRENGYNSNATTNDFGFRNNESVLNPKPEGARRVIAYGGSTTFCYNLLNHQAWPLQLQGLMRGQSKSSSATLSDSTKIQVFNAGAILWSIGHAYARAKRDIPALNPDYVIIYSGINEETNQHFLNLAGTPLEHFVANNDYGKFATNLDQNRWGKRNLFIVRVFDYLIKPLLEGVRPVANASPAGAQIDVTTTDDRNNLPLPVVEENYQKTLLSFLDLIQENKAQAIFVAQAYGKDTPINRRYTAYSKRALELARKHGAITLDAQDMVDAHDGASQDLFSSSGVHYSELGAAMLAEFIYQSVFADTPNLITP